MSLKKYIAEAEERMHRPDVGDTFAIELEDGTLLETYIMAMEDNAILLDATDRIVSVLAEWNYIGEEAGDVLLEDESLDEAQQLDEFLPALGALAGRALAGSAGAGALGRMAAGAVGSALGSALTKDKDEELDEDDIPDEFISDKTRGPSYNDVTRYAEYTKDMKQNFGADWKPTPGVAKPYDTAKLGTPQTTQAPVSIHEDDSVLARMKAFALGEAVMVNPSTTIMNPDSEKMVHPDWEKQDVHDLQQAVVDKMKYGGGSVPPAPQKSGLAAKSRDVIDVDAKEIAEDDYQDEQDVAHQDSGEYDYEGDMAKDDLYTIIRAARRLNGMLDDDENMPEWVQSKINKAADYVDTAADYIESNKERAEDEQGMAEGEDDLVDLGPALRNLTGEFNKFMKHDDRMKTDPAYAKKWNKRYAKYAGNKDHNTYDDPDDDKEQGVAEGSADQWYVVPRGSLDYNGNYYGKGNDVSGPFSKAQAKAELHKAHPSDTNWTIVPAVALMNKGVAEGLGDDNSIWNQYGHYTKQDLMKEFPNITPQDAQSIVNYAEYGWSPHVDAQKFRNEVVKRIKVAMGQQGMDEAKYQGREVPLGKPMRGDVKKFKVYVRDPKSGNVKKVNFGHGGTSAKRAGQKTMKIKKSDPARRRSFRARHHCDNPGPRTKARYWSCRAW